jgi:acetate kinase
VEGLSALGITLNKEVNTVRGEELLLSTPDSKIPVWVVPTNEELKIARETAQVVKKI